MAYLLGNICTKNYWNRTTTIEISLVVGLYPFFVRHSVDAKQSNTRLSGIFFACGHSNDEVLWLAVSSDVWIAEN